MRSTALAIILVYATALVSAVYFPATDVSATTNMTIVGGTTGELLTTIDGMKVCIYPDGAVTFGESTCVEFNNYKPDTYRAVYTNYTFDFFTPFYQNVDLTLGGEIEARTFTTEDAALTRRWWEQMTGLSGSVMDWSNGIVVTWNYVYPSKGTTNENIAPNGFQLVVHRDPTLDLYTIIFNYGLMGWDAAPTNYGDKFGSCWDCYYAAAAGVSIASRQRFVPGSNSNDVRNWAGTTYGFSDFVFNSATRYLVPLPLYGNRPTIFYGNLFVGAQACINPLNQGSEYACISQYELYDAGFCGDIEIEDWKASIYNCPYNTLDPGACESIPAGKSVTRALSGFCFKRLFTQSAYIYYKLQITPRCYGSTSHIGDVWIAVPNYSQERTSALRRLCY